MKLKSHFAIALVAALAASLCAVARAQTAGGQTSRSASSPSQKNDVSPPPQAPQTAPSLLSRPAQPATIHLAAGKLTVEADNSTLAGILDQLSHAGGMKIQGLQAGGKGDQRIFGTYGPDAPRSVLNDLLNGSGYNIIMLGTTPSGLPQELMLSLQSSGGVPNPAAQTEPQMRADYQDDRITPTQYPPAPQSLQPPPALSPQQGVRTPQQMLQELQRRHELEMQQEQQQQTQDQNQ